MFEPPEVGEYEIKLIKDFIASKVRNAGAVGVCLGVSGGVDSAVAAALAASALGSENVYGLILPERATPDEDLRDAELLAEGLGIKRRTIDISGVVRELESLLGGGTKLASANLKARVRMAMIYHTANSNNMLVLGTSNRSEFMLGYFTKYGDGASDIAPLGDLYKTQVWQLASLLELPESIVKKEPTAGLLPGQKDIDELGLSYRDIDRLLVAMESGYHWKVAADMLGIESEKAEAIARRVHGARHKRRGPQVLKITPRTPFQDLREFV